MAKLHELLAVEGQLKGQAQATRTELASTFSKKRHLFEEKIVTFHPNTEGSQPVTEQQSDLQSKVRDELAWIADIWAKAIDVSFMVAEANTHAASDVILEDGTILLHDVPATALLELEKRGAEIRELIMAVPTLDPAKGFQLDADRGANVYRAREVTKTRTKKDARVVVLYPHTAEHPAQVQMISEDVAVGRIVEREWSGLITPAEKGRLIERAEEFTRAVKKARQRANEAIVATDSQNDEVGRAVFAFVFGK